MYNTTPTMNSWPSEARVAPHGHEWFRPFAMPILCSPDGHSATVAACRRSCLLRATLRAFSARPLAASSNSCCCDAITSCARSLQPMAASASVRSRRREMEDTVSIRPGFLHDSGKSHFFGVFDGHGCSHVATTCQELMHEAVAEEHEKEGSGEEPLWKEVMERSFAQLDERAANWGTTRSSEEPACRCEQKMPSRCDHVGSTAVVAVVSPTQLVMGNAGDSRAVLSRAGVPVALSVDHER
ncbi:probable protein phosphatase 2C 9 [Triticum urartu]|uniref:probable protein phosphatase 2C 9 n=1 Tax=Triticum urartu TaxID=4572 RepID=UPI002042E370|nr:probable protein phosphatase 2C 9 [Triticum urartu]